jgi:hypothetical protein
VASLSYRSIITGKPKYTCRTIRNWLEGVLKAQYAAGLRTANDIAFWGFRIAEIELASMGQIPLPIRSGSTKLSHVVDDRRVKPASPLPAFTPNPVEIQQCSNANVNDSASGTTCSTQSSEKQPKMKRSKALSRPLADITKNLNLASLLSEPAPESKDRDRPIKAKGDNALKHSKGVYSTGSTASEGYPRKLDVYRDPVFKATVIATLPFDKNPRRLAAVRAGARNHQLACDDSGVTEIDMLGSDEVSGGGKQYGGATG